MPTPDAVASDPSPDLALRSLTRHPSKPALYSREPFFREAYHDFHGVLGGETEAMLLRHGIVMIKPEGLALGMTTAILDFYASNGFTVAAARPVTLTPLTWRAIWLYQVTLASLDRLAATDLVLVGDALFLLLRAAEPLAVPASVHLSELKGPAAKEDQPENCLRQVIQQPNRIFSLLHAADEPVDVVRECGVLFDPGARRRLGAAMVAGPTEESLAYIEDARRADTRGRCSFDLPASTRRLEEAIEARMAALPSNSADYTQLERATDCLMHERPLRLLAFLEALSETGVEVHRWDLGVALSGLISYDVPGGSQVAANLGSRAWMSSGRARAINPQIKLTAAT